MSSIFGNTGAQTQGQSSNLFGNSTAQPAGAGLFGSSTTQAPGAGLFGSSTTQNQPQQTGAGLFGSSTTQNQPQSTSLFGNNANTQNRPQQASGGGLFGSSTTQTQPQSTSFFGSSTAQQPQQQQLGGSLFGGSTNQQPAQSNSLFGGGAQPTNPQAQNNSLFNSTQQQAPANPSGSLFPQQAPNRTYAERTFNNPQQAHLSSLLESSLSSNPAHFGTLGAHSQHELARSRLNAAGVNTTSNEKQPSDQIRTLIHKWDPHSADTLLQAWTYNAVNAAYAPFYHRNADEGEKEWEEALSKKPVTAMIEGQETSFVPVLVRGFKALGDRVEYQAKTVNEMRTRLHEMNYSLDAIMARHSQGVSVRLENARRQHAALAQRCLRLAVKAQILRNKNYPLDAAEEGLRKTLQRLEAQVFDPQFAGREEEIWARMVSLRDRARWLEEEGRRLGERTTEQQQGAEGVPEEVVVKTKKILTDYDGQLAHLARELEGVKREFGEWEDGQRR